MSFCQGSSKSASPASFVHALATEGATKNNVENGLSVDDVDRLTEKLRQLSELMLAVDKSTSSISNLTALSILEGKGPAILNTIKENQNDCALVATELTKIRECIAESKRKLQFGNPDKSQNNNSDSFATDKSRGTPEACFYMQKLKRAEEAVRKAQLSANAWFESSVGRVLVCDDYVNSISHRRFIISSPTAPVTRMHQGGGGLISLWKKHHVSH